MMTSPRPIASAGRKCRFSFSGQEGDLVSIRMIRQDESLDPFVELRDADGNILASDNDSAGNSNSEIGGYQLPGSGIYTIVTQSYNNATTGAFELSLTESPQARACGDEIAYGETGYGEIAETSDSCVYGFSGQEGDLVSIRMIRQDESLDPFVELRDADGNILASDDDSAGNSNSEIGGYQLPGSGIYTIVTQSYNDATTGAFELSLTESPDSNSEVPISGDTALAGLMGGNVTWTEAQFSSFLTELLRQDTGPNQPVDAITAWFDPDNHVHLRFALKDGVLLGGESINA